MSEMIDDFAAFTDADFIAFDRIECENSLYWFVQQCWHVLEPQRPLIPNWHIEAVCQHLEAAARGLIPRLAISIPPGHSKSLLTAVFFNAWVWTWAPHKRFISTGSSETFCERDNGKLRSIIRSDWYQKRWPMSFPNVDTVLRFENEKTGFRWGKSYLSLTGGRANFLILDDVLPADQANSETERNKVNRRFFETATSRLEDENDSIIIIQQRLNQNDLIGEIMERQGKGEDLGFDCLSIPMELGDPLPPTSIGWTDPRTERNDIICPAYRSQKWVDREKVTMGVFAWSAQMNQEPIPRGDGFFRESDFRFYDPRAPRGEKGALPVDLVHYIASDHALGTSAKGDYNVVRVWGVDAEKNHWLVDSFRERCSINVAIGVEMVDGKLKLRGTGALPFIKRYQPIMWVADNDQIIQANEQFIRDAMRSTGASCKFEIIKQGGKGKVERASTYQSMSELGQVYLPDTDVGRDAVAEYVAFPVGKHDDQVDADSLLPRLRTHKAYVAPVARREPIDDYIVRAELDEMTSASNSY